MSDRHDKWVSVEPGTVIPAGQPHRIEWGDSDDANERTHNVPRPVPHDDRGDKWFIDSSWKPPLDLPTEPTWGIAVKRSAFGGDFKAYGTRWCLRGKNLTDDQTFNWHHEGVLDFIPLTDEQVARIEAHR